MRLSAGHLDLPEGTELHIPLPTTLVEANEDNSPAGIAAWLRWYDTLKPLVRSSQEERIAEDWLTRCDQHERSQQDRDIKDLFQ